MGMRLTPTYDRPRGRRFLGLTPALVVVGVLGCGRAGPTLAPVDCRVTLDGKPVEGAAVGFLPVGGGPIASGTTDAQGRFQLMTMNRPGAPVGKHVVTVTKVEQSGIKPDGTIAPGGIKTKWLVPEKYSKPATSGLTAIVDRDGLQRDFELSSK
jgi:hypothetical protein